MIDKCKATKKLVCETTTIEWRKKRRDRRRKRSALEGRYVYIEATHCMWLNDRLHGSLSSGGPFQQVGKLDLTGGR
jgi:hypothetical protein